MRNKLTNKNRVQILFSMILKVVVCLIISNLKVYSQSKKEQIQFLTLKVDSINNILNTERTLNIKKSNAYDSIILILNKNNSTLKTELDISFNKIKNLESLKNEISKDLEKQIIQIKILKDQISNIDSMKSKNIDNQYKYIFNLLEVWKNDKIKNNEYLPKEKCNMEYIQNSGDLKSYLAVPEEINFIYGDLNNDNKIDALVWFAPVQCDGGNACMYCKDEVLFISNGDGYIIDEEFTNLIERKNELFLFDYYSISENIINGYYWKQNNENRSSNLKGKFSINYSTRKVEFY